MALELIGKLIKKLPVQSGTSARGVWSKQDFIIETQEQYPRKVCVSAWGERVNELSGMAEGDMLKVSFNVESREFNERWYTDVRAWRIEKQQAEAPVASASQSPASQPAPGAVPPPPPADDPFGASEQEADDLPF
ncbi:MAG: DUF3127 domain-containing protein [Prevotellaceae bacterium]|jgi:hypothetical protein|nr:DUF3127 domain-containing protein [Prevotellaceae bacterium]